MSNILDDINLLFEESISERISGGIDNIKNKMPELNKTRVAYAGGGAATAIAAGKLFYNHLIDSGVSKKEISSNYISDFNKIEAFYTHNYNFFKRNFNFADTDISRLRDAFIERDPKAAQRLLEDLDTENFPNQDFNEFKSIFKDLTDISLSAQYGSINVKSVKDFFGSGGIFTQDFNNIEVKKIVMDRTTDKIFNGDLDNDEIADILNAIPQNKESINFFQEKYGLNIRGNLNENDINNAFNNLRQNILEDNDILKYLELSSKEQINSNKQDIFLRLKNLDNDDQRLEVLKVLDKKNIPFDHNSSDYSSFDDITVLTDNLDGFSSKNVNLIINDNNFINTLEIQSDNPIELLESLSSLDEYSENLSAMVKEKINNYDQYNNLVEYLSNSDISQSNKDFVVGVIFSNSNSKISLNLSQDSLSYLISEHSGVDSFKNYILATPPSDINNENLKLLIQYFGDESNKLNISDISLRKLLDTYKELGDHDGVLVKKISEKLGESSNKEDVADVISIFDNVSELYNELGPGYFQKNPDLLEELLKKSDSDLIFRLSTDEVLTIKTLQNINFFEIPSTKVNLLFDELVSFGRINFKEIFNNPDKYESFIGSLNKENIKELFERSFDEKEILNYVSSSKFSSLPDNAKSTISNDIINFEMLFGEDAKINIELLNDIVKIKSENLREELLNSIKLKVKESGNEELVDKFNSYAKEFGLDKINNIFDDIKELLFSGYGLASIILVTGTAVLATSGILYKKQKKQIEKSVYKISKYYKLEEEYVYLISDVHYDFSNLFKKKIRNEREYKYKLYEKFNKFKNYIDSHENKNKIVSDIESGKFFEPLDEYFGDKKRTSDINLTIAKNIKKPDNFNSFKNEFFIDETLYF